MHTVPTMPTVLPQHSILESLFEDFVMRERRLIHFVFDMPESHLRQALYATWQQSFEHVENLRRLGLEPSVNLTYDYSSVSEGEDSLDTLLKQDLRLLEKCDASIGSLPYTLRPTVREQRDQLAASIDHLAAFALFIN